MRIRPLFALLFATTLASTVQADTQPGVNATAPSMGPSSSSMDRPSNGTTSAVAWPEQVVPGHVLLRLAQPPNAAGATVQRLSSRLGKTLTLDHAMLAGWGLYRLQGVLTEAETLALVAVLQRDHEVKAAAADQWMRPLAAPNDEFFGLQWQHALNNAPAAWDLTTGETSQYIGVVDTGVNTDQPDLRNKDQGGYDFISDTTRAADGDGRDADFSDPGGITECNGRQLNLLSHGTHVSGILLGEANNGVGIAGVNWNAQLVSARALNQCGGAESDVLDALAWLAGFSIADIPDNAHPVTLANVSLGSAGNCSAISQDYVNFLRSEKNFLIVAATGNESFRDQIFNPANCTDVISVSAHGPQHELAPYANFTEADVDIVAPGGNMTANQQDGILSTCGEEADCYVFGQGTSMATPYVTGAVSLMRALSPDLSHEQIVQILKDTGVPCEGCGTVKALQLDAALAAVAEKTTSPFVPATHDACPNDPCLPNGGCAQEGTACYLDDAQTPCCFSTCPTPNSQEGCGDLVCQPADDTTNICRDVGTFLLEGETCGNGTPGLCSPGTICGGLEEGVLICLQRCDGDFVCRDTTQSCNDAGDFSICAQPLDPADAALQSTCDNARGSWDCADGWGCQDGVCIKGAQGELGVGLSCQDAAECASGLCVEGACSVPCDTDGTCFAGATCDTSTVAGGICVPNDCSADATVCGDSLSCVSGRCVIASGCSCDASTTPGTLLAFAMLFGLLRVRRQRRA